MTAAESLKRLLQNGQKAVNGAEIGSPTKIERLELPLFEKSRATARFTACCADHPYLKEMSGQQFDPELIAAFCLLEPEIREVQQRWSEPE